MSVIDTNLLEKAVYNLCLQAGQKLSFDVYNKILSAYKQNKSSKLANILKNAQKASIINRPLCQDTGTVHVFLEIGNEVSFSSNPIDAINNAVAKCYKDNYFRKSIVENEFISGKNTETNTPALINIDYVFGNTIKINLLLKGAGCDNVSEVKMVLPTITKEEFVDYAVDTIIQKGQNACPPLFVSIAVGTGAEKVMIEAEKAYFKDKSDLIALREEILKQVNQKADKVYEDFYIADLKISAKHHHMASLPVAFAFNCHSLRIASAIIENNSVIYDKKEYNFENIKENDIKLREINTSDIDEIKKLKEGEKVLLSGEIIIARDAAHKKMLEYKKNNKKLPFDIVNKVIFYAAPCPAKPDEIVGSIGPTTAYRMDKFLPDFPEILATIGKGRRSEAAIDFIKENHSIYFEVEGGISTLLASCFESYKIIAFEELSTEAVCLAKIKNLPVTIAASYN